LPDADDAVTFALGGTRTVIRTEHRAKSATWQDALMATLEPDVAT
jgi:hypothetical protein